MLQRSYTFRLTQVKSGNKGNDSESLANLVENDKLLLKIKARDVELAILRRERDDV